MRKAIAGFVLAALAAAPVLAQDAYPAEGDLPAQPEVKRPATPIPPEQFDKMVPKHPGQLGVLAPANVQKARPKPPFDLTGTWFVDLRQGFTKFMPSLSEILEGRARGADRRGQGGGRGQDVP